MGTNEKILRNAYGRFAAGDMEHLYTVLSDKIVWKVAGNRDTVPFAGEWTGKEGVQKYFTISRSEWDVREHQPLEFFSTGNDTRFAVRMAIDVVHRKNGGRFRTEKVDLVTMKDGKVVEYSELFDTAITERTAKAVVA